jgi:2-methylisocitrate lyase-like PEP mutase family enzyme
VDVNYWGCGHERIEPTAKVPDEFSDASWSYLVMNDEKKSLAAAAQALRDLHRVGEPLLLVNAWDAATARRVEGAGGRAVATSSAAVAGSSAAPDNNTARSVAFEAARQVANAVGVPVTADLEGGYGLSGGALVEALLGAGAVGCNIEDTDHTTGDRLLDAHAHAAYLADIRSAADTAGVPVVINARIDAIIRSPGRDPVAAKSETINRAQLYFEAGADCVYPIGLNQPSIAAELIEALGRRPVNVNPSNPLQALADAGAARISLGAGPFHFLMGEFERRTKLLLAGDAGAFT